MFDSSIMPTLAKFVQNGVQASSYHSIYPTHTRAINTTLATGCTPGRHGWMANVFRADDGAGAGIVNTAEASHVQALDDRTGLNAIQVPTLGDLLARHGMKVGVATTQSSGASLIFTRKQSYPVATVSTTYGRSDMQAIRDRIGEPPGVDSDKPSKIPHAHWAKQAVIDTFLDDPDASVIYFYMVEPDFSLHYYGLGAPEVSEALAECDRALAEVLDAMESRGIRDQFDIIVLSDHGHSTTLASNSLAEHLDRAGMKIGSKFPALTTASDYIYAAPGHADPSPAELEPVVQWLQEQAWTGAVFGRAEYTDLPGILPLSALWNGVDGNRAPLLAINPAWSNESNEHGVPGVLAALTEQAALRSSHGSCSPFEMHAFWAGNGPGFLEGRTTSIPAGATDLVPTILSLLGLPVPDWIDGRVMLEAFQHAPAEPQTPAEEEIYPAHRHPDGFAPILRRHRVGKTTYIHAVDNGHPEGFSRNDARVFSNVERT